MGDETRSGRLSGKICYPQQVMSYFQAYRSVRENSESLSPATVHETVYKKLLKAGFSSGVGCACCA